MPKKVTLTVKVVDQKAKRRRRKAILNQREFTHEDFTRAWRSMRCWAWRKNYTVVTSKEDARATGKAELAPEG